MSGSSCRFAVAKNTACTTEGNGDNGEDIAEGAPEWSAEDVSEDTAECSDETTRDISETTGSSAVCESVVMHVQSTDVRTAFQYLS